MIKEYTYTYTCTINFDFDAIIEAYELNENSSIYKCRLAIYDHCQKCGDEDAWMIDNEDEIAQDIFNYLQTKDD